MFAINLLSVFICALIVAVSFHVDVLTLNNGRSFLENTATALARQFHKAENPCNATTTYTIGSFDSRFGITKEEFKAVMNEAAEEWNKAADRELLSYRPNGSMKINLVYDVRQEDTQRLQRMDPVIDKMEASLNALIQEFDVKKGKYDEHKLQIASLKQDEELYKKESALLEAEKVAAKKIAAERDVLYERYEKALNHYNTLSVYRRGEEFDVGRYYTSNNRKQLDVFEFNDTLDLKRLLMHELGHALGLDHTNNIGDVMYELNKSTSTKLTANDVRALKQRCVPRIGGIE